MPQLIESVEFNLDNPQENRKFLKHLRGKKSAQLVTTIPSNLDYVMEVIRSGSDNDQGFYWIENAEQLIWLVKFETIRKTWLPCKATTQVALWRAGHIAFTEGATKTLFFNVVLPRTGCVLSDRLQTEDGRRFWTARLRDALNLDFNIALANFDRHEVASVTTFRQVFELSAAAWGDAKTHQNKRWLIWK